MADVMEFNYLHAHGAFSFNAEKKLEIDFKKLPQVVRALLEDIIKVQLSKSPDYAKQYIDKWSAWTEMQQYIAEYKRSLGVKPYIDIVMNF